MRSLVIGFAGKIATGKTTLSQGVAEALGWPYASFGDYVRHVAKTRGMPIEDRAILQQVGASLIAAGWEAFCHSVLVRSGWEKGMPAVVDGIRHMQAIEKLREMVSPLPFRLIYIDLDDSVRESRLRSRQPEYTMTLVEQDSTEVQVRSLLRDSADVVVDGNTPLRKLISEVLDQLEEH